MIHDVLVIATNPSGSTSDQIQIDLDATPAPVIVSIEVGKVSATTVVITLDKTLDASSIPSLADFTIKVDGSSTGYGVSSVGVSGATVTFTIATAINAGEVVTLDYTSGTNKIQPPSNRTAVPYTGIFSGTNITYTSTLVGGGALPLDLVFDPIGLTFTWTDDPLFLAGFVDMGVTNSLDAVDMLGNLPDSIDTFLSDALTNAIDSLSAAGQVPEMHYWMIGKLNTSDNSLSDIRQGSAIAIANNGPIWNQYQYWDMLGAEYIDTRYSGADPAMDVNSLGYIWKGEIFTSGSGAVESLFGMQNLSDPGASYAQIDTNNNEIITRVNSVNEGVVLSGVTFLPGDNIVGIFRTSATSQTAYLNDDTPVTETHNASALPARFGYIGAQNDGGSPGTFSVQRFKHYMVVTGAADFSAIKTILDTLDAEIQANAPIDTEAPTVAPTMAAATGITSNSAVLNASDMGTDNVGVVRINWYTTQRGFEGFSTGLSFTLGSLASSTQYDYYGEPVDAAGLVGPQSSQLNFTTLASGLNSFSDDFEGVDPLGTGPYLLQGENDPDIFNDGGNNVVRCSLTIPGSGQTYGNPRSDVQKQGNIIPFNLVLGQEYTYKIKFKIPTSHTFDNTSRIGMMNIHTPNGTNPMNGSPFNIQLGGNGDEIVIRAAEQPVFQGFASDKITHHQDTGFIVSKNTWYHVTVQFKQRRWTGADTESYARVYINSGSDPVAGDIIYDLGTGNNDNMGYNETEGGFLKPMTCYIWDWKTSSKVEASRSAGVGTQTIYYDDFSIQEGITF